MKSLLIGALALISASACAENNFSKCAKGDQVIQLVQQTENKTDILGRIDGIYIGVSAERTANAAGQFYISKIASTTVMLKIDNEYGKGTLQIFGNDGLIEKKLICN